MPGVTVPSRVRLRLDRHQRARDADIPMISVLVGGRSEAMELWGAWLGERSRACLAVEYDRDPLSPQLVAALIAEGPVVRDIAAFIARTTGEPPAVLERRLRSLGRPERAALLDHAGAVSGLPDVARFAGELLESSGDAAISEGDARSLVTLLQLRSPEMRPGLSIATSALHPALGVLQAIAERLPQLPVALAVETSEIDRFLTSPGSSRDRAMVYEGLVRLDESVATPAPDHSPHVEALCQELAALCKAEADQHAHDRARSVAERLLLAALEDHPSTRGRFELNARVEFSFGNRPAEIDLLSRHDSVAIEIDGYHHFVDADAYRRDRRKDVLLQRHGLFVLRFLAQDVARSIDEIIDRIVDVLHRPPPSGQST